MQKDIRMNSPEMVESTHWKVCSVKIEFAREENEHNGYIEIFMVKSCVVDGVVTLIPFAIPERIVLTDNDYDGFLASNPINVAQYLVDTSVLDGMLEVE